MNLVEISTFRVTRLWLSSNCASSKSSRFGDRRKDCRFFEINYRQPNLNWVLELQSSEGGGEDTD